MTRQRWFANKGALPVLEEIGSWEYATDEPGVRIVTHLMLDHTVGKPALYQVPLTYRNSPVDHTASLVGEFDGRGKYLRDEYTKGRSPADVVLAEKERENRIRAPGPTVVRWGWEEAMAPPLLRRKLLAAGLPLGP